MKKPGISLLGFFIIFFQNNHKSSDHYPSLVKAEAMVKVGDSRPGFLGSTKL